MEGILDSKEMFPGIFVKGDPDGNAAKELLDDRWFVETTGILWKRLGFGFVLESQLLARHYSSLTGFVTNMAAEDYMACYRSSKQFQAIYHIFDKPSTVVQELKEFYRSGREIYVWKNGTFVKAAVLPPFSTPRELEMKLDLRGNSI